MWIIHRGGLRNRETTRAPAYKEPGQSESPPGFSSSVLRPCYVSARRCGRRRRCGGAAILLPRHGGSGSPFQGDGRKFRDGRGRCVRGARVTAPARDRWGDRPATVGPVDERHTVRRLTGRGWAGRTEAVPNRESRSSPARHNVLSPTV